MLPEILIIPALLGTALMAGLFFIFSNTVMTALSEMPDAEGIRAMQGINRVILNPVFLSAFLGTAVLALVIAILAIIGWGEFASHWYLSAACLYLFGTFFYTLVKNVPLNEKLDRVDPDEAAGFWRLYLKTWTRYNHYRAVSSFLSVGLYAIGLVNL